jgi:hypothetical protein
LCCLVAHESTALCSTSEDSTCVIKPPSPRARRSSASCSRVARASQISLKPTRASPATASQATANQATANQATANQATANQASPATANQASRATANPASRVTANRRLGVPRRRICRPVARRRPPRRRRRPPRRRRRPPLAHRRRLPALRPRPAAGRSLDCLRFLDFRCLVSRPPVLNRRAVNPSRLLGAHRQVVVAGRPRRYRPLPRK